MFLYAQKDVNERKNKVIVYLSPSKHFGKLWSFCSKSPFFGQLFFDSSIIRPEHGRSAKHSGQVLQLPKICLKKIFMMIEKNWVQKSQF